MTAYLQRAANSPRDVSALDAVMGEDWAHFKAGDPKKALQVEFMMRRARRRGGAGLSFQVGRRAPQAMVKLIRKGGATGVVGLRAQMDYLRKGGAVDLQRSERYFGAVLDEDQQALVEVTWGLVGAKPGGADRTSHFVVSFPPETDPDAAARAGRAWAEEMFGSGRFGDRYDYYTADHRDTAHPHTHVVVARRGLDRGDWLKVSQRTELNYDMMRRIQVEVAEAEGIVLEATPRLARGVHERPARDVDFWSKREGRERDATPPPHTEATAIATAATIVAFSRQYEAEMDVIASGSPRIKARFEALISSLRAGHQIAARRFHSQRDLEEEKAMSARYADKRAEILKSFDEMDRGVAALGDPAKRVELERHVADLRRDAAPLLPDLEDLQLYRAPAASSAYQGVRIEGGGDEAEQVRIAAGLRVAAIAKDAGLDPDEIRARYGPQAVSAGLSRQWREREIAARMRSSALAGQGVETADQARAAVDDAHRRIETTWRAAEERLGGMGLSLPEAAEERRAEAAHERRGEDGARGAPAGEGAESPRRLPLRRERDDDARDRTRDAVDRGVSHDDEDGHGF